MLSDQENDNMVTVLLLIGHLPQHLTILPLAFFKYTGNSSLSLAQGQAAKNSSQGGQDVNDCANLKDIATHISLRG